MLGMNDFYTCFLKEKKKFILEAASKRFRSLYTLAQL